MIKIDLKDKKLLYELDLNSRLSIPQLSKKVGLHKNVVRYRIRRLEKLGVIKNYYTVIDSYKLGFRCLKFLTTYQNATSTIKKEIIDHFTSNKMTWLVSSIEGEFDLDVIFWIKDMNQFYSFWAKTLSKYGQYLKEQILFYQIQATSYRPSYLLFNEKRPVNEKYEITGQASTIIIDDLDYSLLKLIASNARIPIVTLAENLNVTSNIVRYRLKKLFKSDIIQGFRVDIDFSKIGFLSTKVDLFLNKYGERDKVIKYLKDKPFVVCVMISVGYSHIELELNVESMKQHYRIMGDLIDKFSGIINNYKFFRVLENYKLCWMPEEQ
jgi:Lrp/AsnC family transcriptional regulator for asnA, asnC and gidA